MRRTGGLILFMISGLLGLAALATAGDSLQAMALQRALVFGDKLALPDDAKESYISQGQEYIRDYLREQVLGMLNSYWSESDMNTWDPLAFPVFGTGKPGTKQPLAAQIRLRASDDLNQYLDGDAGLPVAVVVDSVYRANSQFLLRAHLDAPFNDFVRIRLASEIRWTQWLSSQMEYRLRNQLQAYDGFHVGVGWNVQHWHMAFQYHVDANFQYYPCLCVEKTF